MVNSQLGWEMDKVMLSKKKKKNHKMTAGNTTVSDYNGFSDKIQGFSNGFS